MKAIFKREFKSYFINMIGYIFLGALFCIVGFLTSVENLISGYAQFEYNLGYASLFFIILIPILATRSMCDDKRLHMSQLLYSLPIRSTSVVLGKYFALVAVLGIGCAGIAVVPVVLAAFGTLAMRTIFSALFGFFLLGCVLIAICMFISSLVGNQIIATLLSILTCALLYLISLVVSSIPAGALASFLLFIALILIIAAVVYMISSHALLTVCTAALGIVPVTVLYIRNSASFEGKFAEMVQYIAVFDRFYNFVYGTFDLTAVLFFLSMIVFFVFLTVQSFDYRRWA